MRLILLSIALTCACAPGSDRMLGLPIDTGHVTVAGSSLYYESVGAGAPVILIHGDNLDRRMWNAEFGFLAQRYRVTRYDARGFGRSGPADTAFAAHEDLLSLMVALKIPHATLIGLSFGGRVAIDFALAHPEMIDGLVLAAPGISGGTWADDGDSVWLATARRAAFRRSAHPFFSLSVRSTHR